MAQDQPQARVATFCADVSDPQLAQAAVRAAVEAHGGLDILVNNAAKRNYSALADVTPEEWHAVVAVNLVGASNYCQAALPALRKSGKGAIVHVSSCSAETDRKSVV